jgi:ABC-type antimicrobial peptide transport system permease subunit
MNWKRFLRREAADAEQQEELEFYVDVTAEEYVERGMNPEAARAAARRKLGNMTLIREEIYRMNTVTLIGIAAAMALSLAVVGVYGVLAYAVARRRHEVGIRLALGAQPSTVRALFVRQGLLLTSLGGILGLVSSVALSRWISSLLYGVTALDPLTYALSGAAVAAGAILASVVPARRAASVDPMETLRSD